MDLTAERFTKAAGRRLVWGAQRYLRVDPVTRRLLSPRGEWRRLGSDGCGWLVPGNWGVNKPVCVCVGAGEDITFDLALRDEYDAQVIILDPTPRAIAHVEKHLGGREDVSFRPWAVWSSDGTVDLFEPRDPGHVSHSIVNLQGTEDSFQAEARTIATLMHEFGLERIDLLKLDIEGAEYDVIGNVLDSGCEIDIIDVEFDELSIPKPGAWSRIRACVDLLETCGYRLMTIDMGSNYTFVRAP